MFGGFADFDRHAKDKLNKFLGAYYFKVSGEKGKQAGDKSEILRSKVAQKR